MEARKASERAEAGQAGMSSGTPANKIAGGRETPSLNEFHRLPYAVHALATSSLSTSTNLPGVPGSASAAGDRQGELVGIAHVAALPKPLKRRVTADSSDMGPAAGPLAPKRPRTDAGTERAPPERAPTPDRPVLQESLDLIARIKAKETALDAEFQILRSGLESREPDAEKVRRSSRLSAPLTFRTSSSPAFFEPTTSK